MMREVAVGSGSGQSAKQLKANPFLTFISGTVMCFFISCSSSSEKEKNITNKSEFKKHILNPTYAKGFTIYENDSVIRFTSRNPDDTNQIYKVLDFKKRELPFTKIAITSTTHAFLFDAIGANNSIVGMSAMSYLLDSNLKGAYTKNKVVELGKDDNLNREIIIKLNPEILMVYPCPGCDYSTYEKAGIIVVNNAEYLEQDPLGRAEWIKVTGLLTGKDKKALAFFDTLEIEYNSTGGYPPPKTKPLVILGKPIDNVWHVPGNNSFAARLVEDAGGEYSFAESKGNNVKTQTTEWVIEHASKADFWVFTDYSTTDITLSNLASQNKIYKALRPFDKKHVIACNSAKDDFFGKAVIEPQILLQDLIYHLHGIEGLYGNYPDSPKTYTPTYFKLVKEK